jgi:tRNA A37 N6-isopentenylltransferase MiaA
MKRIGIIILATSVIICSCSRQEKPQTSLEKAIEKGLVESLSRPAKCSIIEIEKLDSTIFLTEFNRRTSVFEMRIEQNKKFHDDYYRRGLKKNAAIHQFAKRQMTWFRGMERKGIEIEWIKI